MKEYWFGLLVSALLFSSCGYCARDWIPRESDGIKVSYLTTDQAAEMRELIRTEEGR